MDNFETIIVGAGQGGVPLARAFAGAGKRTVLIERTHVGGTCVNEGCTPSKTMIASGRVAYLARRGADYGVETGPIAIDMARVRQRKRDIVESFRTGSEHRLQNTANLELVRGDAAFTGPHSLQVRLNGGGERVITAPTIVINAGERPRPLDLPGASELPVLNSTSIMELEEVPAHLLVIGGGPIGLEFGQLFRRLGSAVTIVHRSGQLLSREDADVAGTMHDILDEDGIDILLNATPAQLEGAPGDLRLTVRLADGERNVQATHLLDATGRLPNTDTLALDTAGVTTDQRGYIPTDNQLRTNVAGVYAIGDVRPGPKFTHISYDDYRILEANLLRDGDRSIAGRLVPYCVFTDPELGRVGLSEREAREQGRAVRVAKMPMSSVARALETDESRGVMKALVDPDTDRILGCAILGVEGGELMSMIEIAMMGDLPYTALRDGIFAHPAMAESLNNLFFAFEHE
jgi:pyruvate/2-oxoglutarate dehydrogenase complex dihydrolipoamide dehydrogenase (E3) component